jgi:hypothetical protein
MDGRHGTFGRRDPEGEAMNRKTKETARLHWAGNTLWLGPWKAAELTPVWCGFNTNRAPDGWRARVGAAWEADSDQTRHAALIWAEHVVGGQLSAIGVRRAEYRRQDGTVTTLVFP